jgi:hypothetical protein
MEFPELPLSWKLTEGIPGRDLKLQGLPLLPWTFLLEPATLTSPLGTEPVSPSTPYMPSLLPDYLCQPPVYSFQTNWRQERPKVDTTPPVEERPRARKWKPEEDETLKKLVKSHGVPTRFLEWAAFADSLKGRTPKQCRDRWKNHLDPHLSPEPWTAEEDALLLKLQAHHGNSWASFLPLFPGRSRHAISNRFASLLLTLVGTASCAIRPASLKRPSNRKNSRQSLTLQPLILT